MCKSLQVRLDRRLSRFEHAETPLHFAARRHGAEVVELLLQLGADLEAVDDRGRSPLGSALLAENEATANVLRAAGAKFSDVVKMNLYVVGLKPEHVPVIREVRSRYVSAEHPPAWLFLRWRRRAW